MTGAQQLPGLDAFSEADKDRLIHRLWQDLRAERARSAALEQCAVKIEDGAAAAAAEPRPLLAELQRYGTDKRRAPSTATPEVATKLGRNLGFLRSRAVISAILVGGLVLALDQGIGWYQRHRPEQKRAADLRLAHAAYAGLFVELVNVAYEPDQKSYRLTMAMKNLQPEQPIYVMLAPVRVFEQVGLAWKEVPARAPTAQSTRVVKLTDRVTYETLFEPNLKDWTELMPGYMHIRFENNRLISQRSDPDGDIIERTDRHYVYLKPHGADNEAIRRRMKYAGEPPVYIPMPAH
jgi:hypothetical protein